MVHIIARGIERREIFTNNSEYQLFLDRLGEILTDTQTKCFAFCLMPNHFHLLLESSHIPIATAMRRLLTGYAVNFNKAHRRAGHLFQNRYKSIICQKESYLLELIRYIHLNPIRAKLAKNLGELENYNFSSHSALLGKANQYPWYNADLSLSYFGSTKRKAKNTYLEFIKDSLSMGKNPIYTGGGLKRSLGNPKVYPKQRQAYDDRILGDGDFVLSLDEFIEKEQTKIENTKIKDLVKNASQINNLKISQISGDLKTKELNETRNIISRGLAENPNLII